MATNTNLNKAKKAKQDEFYTQYVDVANELEHYKEHFRGKVIYCNCDDPRESNFFKYLIVNFNAFGIKKVIATFYVASAPPDGQLPFDDLLGTDSQPSLAVNEGKRPFKIEINEVGDIPQWWLDGIDFGGAKRPKQ